MNKNVMDFGAIADGVTLTTEAFNAAINACAESGGGYVEVPAGEYVCGSIYLKSNVILVLAPGCTVYASMDIKDFIPLTHRKGDRGMISASEIVNSGVIGAGVLDCRRTNELRAAHPGAGRPSVVAMEFCENFILDGITLKDTGGFTIYSFYNTNVTFHNIKITTRGCENGDGIDFSGSKNVVISDCFINTGDDAIGLKTHHPGEDCENFTITNCVITTRWAAVRLGPETCGHMKNITISNCVFNDCADGVKVQLCDTFRMEDITVSNISMKNVVRPFFITSSSCPMSGRTAKRRPDPGIFRRLLINNVSASMDENLREWFDPACVIQGIPDGIVEDVEISNFHFLNAGGGTEEDARKADHTEFVLRNGYPDIPDSKYPACGLYIKNAKNVKLFNCTFDNLQYDHRTAIAAESVENLKMMMTEARNCAGLLRHYKVDNLQTALCDGEMITFTDEQIKEWEDHRAVALEQEAMVIRVCGYADDVRRIPEEYTVEFVEHDDTRLKDTGRGGRETKAVPEITFEQELTETDKYNYYISTNVIKSVYVDINGENVFKWDRPRKYDRSHMFCLKLPIEKDGKYTVKVYCPEEGGGLSGKGTRLCKADK